RQSTNSVLDILNPEKPKRHNETAQRPAHAGGPADAWEAVTRVAGPLQRFLAPAHDGLRRPCLLLMAQLVEIHVHKLHQRVLHSAPAPDLLLLASQLGKVRETEVKYALDERLVHPRVLTDSCAKVITFSTDRIGRWIRQTSSLTIGVNGGGCGCCS